MRLSPIVRRLIQSPGLDLAQTLTAAKIRRGRCPTRRQEIACLTFFAT